ncbi:sensor histidine kinase [Solirubrobacter taibaiensis]|nr:sensor histidine kinase [Solirubrobacter taibaiensis]
MQLAGGAVPRTRGSVWNRRLPAALGVVGAALCLVSVGFVVYSAPADEAVARGTISFLVIAVPIAAGLYALRVPENARFGFALLAAGFAWSSTALGESSESLAYSIGRVAGWLVFPSLIYLMLAFPQGRIGGGTGRALFRALIAVLVLMYLGSALVVEHYPPYTPWATCRDACPPNAFLLLTQEPAVIAAVVQPLRETLAIVLFSAAVVSMVVRWRAATSLTRRTLTPVVWASLLSVGLLAAFFLARRFAPEGRAAETLGLLWGLAVAVLAAALWVGLMRRRLLVGEVLAGLTARLSNGVDACRLQEVLRVSLDDPTLEVLIPDGPVRWLDSSGHSHTRLPGGRGRTSTLIPDVNGTVAVALIHGNALRTDQELLTAVSSLVLGTVRHQDATSKLAAAMRQLEQSRRRIAEAGDLERARIERDLHDGAQQRLMMLRIRLSLVEEQLRPDTAAGADAVHDLGDEAERTLDELRSLAHGVYPAILNDRGLEDALRSLAAITTVPLHLQTRGLKRLPTELETAVYFTCLEAVQNAIKHAPSASAVWVRLGQGADTLSIEVRDDGPGFTAPREPANGSVPLHAGLRNMRDRLEAVGGSLTIDSAPGRGTRVIGRVPLAQDADGAR